MMNVRPIRLAPAVLLALAGLAAPAATLAATGAPTVTLGTFEPLYLSLRPLITLAFVALGISTALLVIWRGIGVVGREAKDSKDDPNDKGGLSYLSALGTILALVVLAIVVLWYGLDIINWAVKLTWTLFSETSPGGTPPPSPSPVA